MIYYNRIVEYVNGEQTAEHICKLLVNSNYRASDHLRSIRAQFQETGYTYVARGNDDAIMLLKQTVKGKEYAAMLLTYNSFGSPLFTHATLARVAESMARSSTTEDLMQVIDNPEINARRLDYGINLVSTAPSH